MDFVRIFSTLTGTYRKDDADNYYGDHKVTMYSRVPAKKLAPNFWCSPP